MPEPYPLRTRTKPKVTLVPYGQMTTSVNDTGTGEQYVSNTGGSTIELTHGKTMTDTLVPNFYERKRTGDLGVSFMSSVDEPIRRFVTSSVSYDDDRPYQIYEKGKYVEYRRHVVKALDVFIPTPSFEPELGIDIHDLSVQAQIALRADLAKTHAMILVTVAEAKKTIVTLGTVMQSFFKELTVLTTKPGRSIQRHVTALQTLWLTSRYGLRPMAYEAAGLLTAFSKQLQPDVWGRRYKKVSASETYVSPTYQNTFYDFSRRMGTVRYHTITTRTVTCKAGTHWRLRKGVPLDVGKRLGATKLATSAWELVPFSFAIDWFTNVSDILGSLELTAEIEMKSRYLSTEIVEETHLVVVGFTALHGNKDTSALASLIGEKQLVGRKITYERNPSSGFVTMAFPSINVNLNPFKVADLFFLSRSWLRGKSKK